MDPIGGRFHFRPSHRRGPARPGHPCGASAAPRPAWVARSSRATTQGRVGNTKPAGGGIGCRMAVTYLRVEPPPGLTAQPPPADASTIALIRSESAHKGLHIDARTAYLASPAILNRAGRDAFSCRRLRPEARSAALRPARRGPRRLGRGLSSVRQDGRGRRPAA